MLASILSLFPGPVRSFFMVAAMVVFAAASTTGVGLASTDSGIDPTDTSVNNPLAEMCDRAVATFHREVDWILTFMELNPDFDPDDPRLARHRDAMWAAWEFAEFTCRIDVGGDGEIG